MEVHWLETGSDSTHSPMLRATFPIKMDNPSFYNHVPFDVVEMPLEEKRARPSVNGNTLNFIVKPHEIVTLGISWK